MITARVGCSTLGVPLGKGNTLRIVGFGNSVGLALARYLRSRTKHPSGSPPELWQSGWRHRALSVTGIKRVLARLDGCACRPARFVCLKPIPQPKLAMTLMSAFVGCTRAVSMKHFRSSPPHDAHQVGAVATCLTPRIRERVPELVRVQMNARRKARGVAASA